MTAQQIWRDEFRATLKHVKDAFGRVSANSGPRMPLRPPDVHKISEGLFLSAWTHWEEFVRHLIILDLAGDTRGQVRRAVSKFRTKGAPLRLAEQVLGHPDEHRWIEWADTPDIVKRADRFLGAGHRYGALAGMQNDLQLLKTIRNGVAHKSDVAHSKFLSLVGRPPFSLTPAQRRGITVGRFLASNAWNGNRVITHAVDVLDANATTLVP